MSRRFLAFACVTLLLGATAAAQPRSAPAGAPRRLGLMPWWCAARVVHPSCLPGATVSIDLDARRFSRGFGHFRLVVVPSTAEVYVDGFYAGTAAAFAEESALTQLRAGAHEVELRAPGYWGPRFAIQVAKGRTTVWRGALEPVANR